MGIFSPNGVSYSEPLDIENMTFIEAKYDNPFEDGMRIWAESELNYNNIMKAIAIDELYVLESTGREMIYEAGALKNFFTKMKEFFKNLWEKIKGIFQKFFTKMNSLIMKDKDFVKKYKPALMKAKTKDFEYEGFEFTNINAPIKDPKSVKEIKQLSEITALGDDETKLKEYKTSLEDDAFDNVMDAYRADLVSKSGQKVASEDFSDALFEYFRNGESTKSTITTINVTDILNEISNTAKVKKDGETALKEIKRPIDAIIKDLERAERDAMKVTPGTDTNTAKVGAYNASIKAYKECMNSAQLFTTAKLQAIKDRNRQARAVCVKLLSYKPTNESAGFVHTEGGSFLDSVVLR